ncbi:MAG: tetratricopeptide repeat protein [Nanoarchaeota archaeon]
MEEMTLQQALNLAAEKHKKGKLEEAEFIYKKILEKNPRNPDAIHLLGLVAYQRGKHEEAINLIKKAIEINKNATYYGNLGMVYDAINEDEKSEEAFETALSIDSEHTNAYLAHYNLGIFLKDRGEFEGALEHYEKAIKLNPNFPEAHWNMGLILLMLGKFEEGWKECIYRFKKQNPSDSRAFGKPQWNGESLEGKKILIASEQGFGDSMQFIRYLPFVKEKKGYIILECKKELEKLFGNIKEVDKIITKEKDNALDKDFDYYIHLMDLPRIFRTNLKNIPNKVPYIKADQNLSKKFRQEFKTGKFNIGIAWAGNPEQDNDKNRSTVFDKFKVLKEVSGIVLFSLQKGKQEEQLDDSQIINLSNKMNDFSDTAALIENLDLIISVDTSVAHLAGAMGKPVWTLLTLHPDWRWLLDRNDTPWYPTMRLFRQKKKGDWDSLLSEVKKELEDYLKNN